MRGDFNIEYKNARKEVFSVVLKKGVLKLTKALFLIMNQIKSAASFLETADFGLIISAIGVNSWLTYWWTTKIILAYFSPQHLAGYATRRPLNFAGF